VLLTLRNALAHGGVAYLDTSGRRAYGPAAMLAFVGARISNRKVVGRHILRIRQADFCEFLYDWAEWLRKSKVDLALSEESGRAA
jgi:hypothetical protein